MKNTIKKQITPLEIYSNSDFSYGDLDVRIIELAAQKHFKLMGIKYGGNPAPAIDLLCGTKDKWKNIASIFNPFDSKSDEELRKIIKNPNTVVTTSINIISKIGMKTKGKEYESEIATQHAYAVVDMDDKYVYLKNVHHIEKPTEKHSDDTFKLPIAEFKKHLIDIEYVTLE